MAFNGSGVYVLPSNSFVTAATDTTIDGTDAQALWADLASALSLCVTNNGETTTPTINSPIIDEILDANSNELVDFVATGSAVNNVRITNAATGNAAKIDVTETDTNLELDGNGTGSIITPTTLLDANGNEWVTHVATGSAVNNVRVTSATTGNAALIDVTETNTDLELAGNGTGGVVVDGLQTKRLDLGSWNMDTTAQQVIAHGLTLGDIRTMKATIVIDGSTAIYDFSYSGGIGANTTNIFLDRTAAGLFDSGNFDSTTAPANRGWVTIQYTA